MNGIKLPSLGLCPTGKANIKTMLSRETREFIYSAVAEYGADWLKWWLNRGDVTDWTYFSYGVCIKLSPMSMRTQSSSKLGLSPCDPFPNDGSRGPVLVSILGNPIAGICFPFLSKKSCFSSGRKESLPRTNMNCF